MNTILAECPDCGGTGLYKGFAEKDGAAVICNKCQGAGYTTIFYNEFTKRKRMENVTRVYDRNYGYVISDQDITTDSGKEMPFSKYGCSYEDWLNGETPKPIEFLCCPKSYTFWDRPCKGCKDLSIGEDYRNCPHFGDVKNCWNDYYTEYLPGLGKSSK